MAIVRHLLQEERHGPVLHAASGLERPAGSERVLPGWHVVRQGRRSELLLHAESMCSRSKEFNSFILGLNLFNFVIQLNSLFKLNLNG